MKKVGDFKNAANRVVPLTCGFWHRILESENLEKEHEKREEIIIKMSLRIKVFGGFLKCMKRVCGGKMGL